MKDLQILSIPPLLSKRFALLLSTLLLITVVGLSATIEGSQQFPLLAQSFLHGRLYFLHPIGGVGQDPLLYKGKIYWGEGPFPAILLLPFVGLFEAFHHLFYTGYLTWVLILGTIYFILRIARSLGYSREDSYLLMLGFTLGSAYVGIIGGSSSWFFAQVVTVFLLFFALYEFYTRSVRRWWLIGILIGCIALARITAAPIILFFILYLVYEQRGRPRQWLNIFLVCLPSAIALGLIGLYNELRFGSPFNGGFAYQLLSQRSAESRALGVFSPIHIPTNVYSAVLKGPDPVLRKATSWSLRFPFIANNRTTGMGIIFTSPYLLQLFTNRWRDISRPLGFLLIAIAVSALGVFSYYGVGAYQFGYRYALDFMPELFVLFMILYRKKHDCISNGMSWLLLGAGVFNFYLLMYFMF